MNITYCGFEPGQLRGVVDLLAAAMPVDPISESRFVRQVLLDPNFRSDGAIVASRGDQVVGFCLALARRTPLENAAPDADRGYITLFAVHPDAGGRGVGTELLRRAEDFLRRCDRRKLLIAPYAPGYFMCGVDVHAYAAALAFFLKRGFTEVYRPIAMERSLWDWTYPEWVEQKRRALVAAGVRVEAYRPELTLPILDFAAAEFAGDWVRVYRQTIDRILQGDSPSRIVAAHHNGKVLGFSHFDNERFGPIGVAAAERGRGVGHVLMYETLRAQRLAGFRTAWFLWSDDQTAKRLYSAAGFRETRRFALLSKDL